MPFITASATDAQLLELLNAVADAVAKTLGNASHSGLTGVREGQYASDVTADTAALQVLHDAGIPVLSEESGVDAVVWPLLSDALLAILDPLDGSTNADLGIPWYSTSVLLVDAKGSRCAMVANQVNGDRYWATRGGGAFKNGNTITPSTKTDLAQAVVGMSGLPSSNPGWWQFRTLGSAALDLCLVASGVLDAWVDWNSHGVWDYAGGLLICEEAGVVVSEANGQDLIHADYEARRTLVVAGQQPMLQRLLIARQECP